MTVLWLSLICMFGLAWLARYYAVPAPALPASVSPKKLLAAAAAMTLALVSGLRSNIGDTFFYMHSYATADFSLISILQQKDIGFNLFQLLLKQFSDDPQFLILVTALITNLLVAAVIYKYARLYELGLYVYVTSGAFTVSMNGIRQFLAAAIVFAATKYMVEGSWKRYFLVVLLASFIHQSALILLPIYFLVRRKAWTGVTFLLLAAALAIVYGYNEFSDALFSTLKDTQYGEYGQLKEGGANVLRVVIAAAPLAVAFAGREKIRAAFPQSDIFVNMSLLYVIIMVISTQNWIFARIAIYFSLYQFVLIAWMATAFRQKDRKLVYLGILGFYFFYYFYESVIALGLRYESDYLTW